MQPRRSRLRLVEYACSGSQLVASWGGCIAGRAEERRPRRRGCDSSSAGRSAGPNGRRCQISLTAIASTRLLLRWPGGRARPCFRSPRRRATVLAQNSAAGSVARTRETGSTDLGTSEAASRTELRPQLLRDESRPSERAGVQTGRVARARVSSSGSQWSVSGWRRRVGAAARMLRPIVRPKMSSVTCGLRYRRTMPRPSTGSERAM